jgi:hypothetical protein
MHTATDFSPEDNLEDLGIRVRIPTALSWLPIILLGRQRKQQYLTIVGALRLK